MFFTHTRIKSTVFLLASKMGDQHFRDKRVEYQFQGVERNFSKSTTDLNIKNIQYLIIT